KHNGGLLAIRRRRIDLRSRLPIGKGQIQGHPSRQGGLAVFAGHLHIDGAVLPRPVWALPAEERLNNVFLLPRGQRKGLARPFALRMPKNLTEEVRSPRGGLRVVIILSHRWRS